MPTDRRIFAIANALGKGYSVDKIHEATSIDRWFLRKLERITMTAQWFSNQTLSQLSTDQLRAGKQLGFSDKLLAKCMGSTELAVRRLRKETGIMPFVKQIDTVAAEFPAHTNYLYTTYHATEHDVSFDDKGIIVLGSGVYRIGSSVEFDWCAVRAVRTLRARGFKTVMINYNPETVSTDYDEADRLYFDEISLETVLDIYDLEQSSGVIISMGGQVPNNIALPLHRQDVKVLGTSPENIDMAENRYKFSRMLDKIGVDQPMWKELTSYDDAYSACERFGYPVLVRPSYVLSGAAMNVVYSSDDLSSYLSQATAVNREHPVVISKYLEGAKEIEMDAVARDGKLVMHYISEHVENAGVHSGDATLILPPQDLDPETVRRITAATAKIADSLRVTGPFNIQFIAKNNEIKVIECNVRAARSFPFVSKVTSIDAIAMATEVMLGLPIEPYPKVTLPKDYVGVKVPQFSFSRLAGADPILGVEMASTGEVACFGHDKYEAYLKGMIASGLKLPTKNVLLSVGSFSEKQELLPSIRMLHTMGYTLYGSSGTADFYSEQGIPVIQLEALPEDEDWKGDDNKMSSYSLLTHLSQGVSSLFISLPSKNKYRRPPTFTSIGYRARRLAIDRSIPLITNVKNAKLYIEALARYRRAGSDFPISSIDFKTSHQTHTFPGLFNVGAFLPDIADPKVGARQLAELTRASLAAGFTTVQLSPFGTTTTVQDEHSLSVIEGKLAGAAYCDVSLALAVPPTAQPDEVAVLSERTRSLSVVTSYLDGEAVPLATAAANVSEWPEGRLLVTSTKGNDLASILLLASLQQRAIHVTGLTDAADLSLISLAKAKGLKVTVDVPVYALFFNRDEFPKATCLPAVADQVSLWDNLAHIDVFTIGSLPYQMGTQLGHHVSAASGIVESMHLLLDAVNAKRLRLEDIYDKLFKAPREIFGFVVSPDSEVQVDVDRTAPRSAEGMWSPLAERQTIGAVSRVVSKGKAVFVDGESVSRGPVGMNVSTSFGAPKATRHLRRVSIAESDLPTSPVLDTTAPAVEPPAALLPARELSPSSALQLAHASFNRRHILSVKQFARDDLHALFSVAQEIRMGVERNGMLNILRNRVLCTLFYEESTRTSSSFEAAMYRLGGQVMPVKSQTSSVAKGETLEDTVRTLGSYTDAIVMRHPAVGSAQKAARASPVPIINAGDGIGEHPTQALLDIFTIREELGTVSGLTVTLLGDLKNGRTTHSLVRLLALYGVTLNYVSPAALAMPREVKAEAARRGVAQYETTDLQQVLPTTDVLYVTRVQKERFSDPAEYEAVKDAYIVNNDVLTRAKPSMIVLHPLPRVNELAEEVDLSEHAAYWRQVKNGVWVRAALLALVMHSGP